MQAMSDVTLDHFKRATADIGAHGDNDTLPFDIDVRFIKDKQEQLAGYQWIASGNGDFARGTCLVEVKCTNRPFSASDYRQILMYWLLSYASSVEGGPPEWSDALLVNPRLNRVVSVSFNDVIAVIGAGRSKVDLLELFSSMVGDHDQRVLS